MNKQKTEFETIRKKVRKIQQERDKRSLASDGSFVSDPLFLSMDVE